MLTMLLLGAWLFIQIPFVSAQESEEQEIPSSVEIEAEVENPLRIAEQVYSFGGETAPAEQSAVNSSVWAVVKMIIALVLAAAAIYGVVYFIKRSSKKTSEGNPFLKILATSHLGSNRYAHIVAVGGKAWLLGSSDGGVNLIGEVEDQDVINAMLLEDSRKNSEAGPSRLPDFLGMLRRLGAPANVRSSAAGSGADDIRKNRERLKGL